MPHYSLWNMPAKEAEKERKNLPQLPTNLEQLLSNPAFIAKCKEARELEQKNCGHDNVYPAGNSRIGGGVIATTWQYLCTDCGLDSAQPIGVYEKNPPPSIVKDDILW